MRTKTCSIKRSPPLAPDLGQPTSREQSQGDRVLDERTVPARAVLVSEEHQLSAAVDATRNRPSLTTASPLGPKRTVVAVSGPWSRLVEPMRGWFSTIQRMTASALAQHRRRKRVEGLLVRWALTEEENVLHAIKRRPLGSTAASGGILPPSYRTRGRILPLAPKTNLPFPTLARAGRSAGELADAPRTLPAAGRVRESALQRQARIGLPAPVTVLSWLRLKSCASLGRGAYCRSFPYC